MKETCYGLVPTGEEFIKLTTEQQEYWLKLVLSASNKTNDILRLIRHEKEKRLIYDKNNRR